MRIEMIACTTNRWYFLMIPSICLFYDSKEKAVGVAFMWLNFIVGAQVSRNKVIIKNNKY